MQHCHAAPVERSVSVAPVVARCRENIDYMFPLVPDNWRIYIFEMCGDSVKVPGWEHVSVVPQVHRGGKECSGYLDFISHYDNLPNLLYFCRATRGKSLP